MAQFKLDLPTMQQSLPILQAISGGQGMLRQHLQNQAQRQKNKVSPKMDAATLANLLARTEGQKLTTKQMPERLSLDEYKATIMAQNAVRGLQNIQLQNQKMDAYYANAASRSAASQPGMIAQGMDPKAAQGALAGAGGFAQRFGQRFQEPGAGFSGVPPQASPAPQIPMPNFPGLQQYMGGQGGQPQMQQPAQRRPQMQPQQQPQSQLQQQLQNQMQQPQQQPQQQQGGPSPEMVKALQDAQMSASIKKTTTAQILNQRHYSELLDDLIEDATPNMIIAIKSYSGVGGKARLTKDRTASLLPGGKVTPELEAFDRTQKVATQFLANEITRSLGEAHNLATASEMRALANPIHWDKNPQLALAQWDELIKNSKRVSKTLAHSPAQTQARLRAIPDEGSQAQPSASALSSALSGASSQAGTVSAAPSGTVEMVDEKGNAYAIPHADVSAAMQHGWRHANG